MATLDFSELGSGGVGYDVLKRRPEATSPKRTI
ncbi:hypothetical protein V1281_001551 [Nitrobacteraceae bacterium AZCC 2161]